MTVELGGLDISTLPMQILANHLRSLSYICVHFICSLHETFFNACLEKGGFSFDTTRKVTADMPSSLSRMSALSSAFALGSTQVEVVDRLF